MSLPFLDIKLWPLPSALLLVGACVAAVVVYRTAPYRAVNRALARLLVLEGVIMGFSAGWNQMVESEPLSYLLAVIGTAAVAAVPYEYLGFLGAALDAPLTAPFRSKRARRILRSLSLIAAAVVFIAPSLFITDLYRAEWATWNFQYLAGGTLLVRLHAAGALYGLFSALWAYVRTKPGGVARSRALFVASAFGVRDLYIAVVLTLYPVIRPIPFWGDFIYNPGHGIVYVVYLSLLVYGLLHSQLFAIELRVKFALTQSAAGALLAGTFFLLSEIVEALLAIDGLLQGLIAAALVVLVLRPLHRVARRTMDRLMPGVARTPAYLEARRAEIYRAALEGAAQDGRITSAETAILATLRDQLGLDADEATTLEAEVLPNHLATALPETG